MRDAQEQYEEICSGEFQELKDGQTKIFRRLFEDNGTESIQSKLNRHERAVRIGKWFVVSAAALLLSILGFEIRSRLSRPSYADLLQRLDAVTKHLESRARADE